MKFKVIEIEKTGASGFDFDDEKQLDYWLSGDKKYDQARRDVAAAKPEPGDWFLYPDGWIFCVKTF